MIGDRAVQVLDHGYVRFIEKWGSDERIIESARMSTAKGFLGWGPKCKKCCGPPRHYNAHPSGVECIDVIEHMTCNVGNAVKYLWRAGLKDGQPEITDLRKAAWYVAREIARVLSGAPREPPRPEPKFKPGDQVRHVQDGMNWDRAWVVARKWVSDQWAYDIVTIPRGDVGERVPTEFSFYEDALRPLGGA